MTIEAVLKCKKTLNIGMYGGGFDPIHNTHIALALTASQYLNLDALVWVPTGKAWHKAGRLAQAQDRIHMLELAFQGVHMQTKTPWVIDTYEVDRDVNSYTVDALSYLQDKYKNRGHQNKVNWFILLGSDQLNALHTWHNWPQLKELVTPAVIRRHGIAINPDEQVRQTMKWVEIPFEESATSSTKIRKLIQDFRRQGIDKKSVIEKQLLQLLPKVVWDYIQEKQLYLLDEPLKQIKKAD